MENNLLKEYEMLKNEILQKIELHNSVLTFTITTVVAILAFAIPMDKSLLYLLPFCIIIPMSIRVAYYRGAIAKLSAYLTVFLEKDLDKIKWETRNNFLIQKVVGKQIKKHKNVIILFNYYECLALSIVCYALYAIKYVENKEINILMVLGLIVPFILVIWEWYITRIMNNADHKRKVWIKIWKMVRKKEEKQKSYKKEKNKKLSSKNGI